MSIEKRQSFTLSSSIIYYFILLGLLSTNVSDGLCATLRSHHHRSEMLLARAPEAISPGIQCCFLYALLSVPLTRNFLNLCFYFYPFLPVEAIGLMGTSLSPAYLLLGYLICGIVCLYTDSSNHYLLSFFQGRGILKDFGVLAVRKTDKVLPSWSSDHITVRQKQKNYRQMWLNSSSLT